MAFLFHHMQPYYLFLETVDPGSKNIIRKTNLPNNVETKGFIRKHLIFNSNIFERVVNCKIYIGDLIYVLLHDYL